MSEQFFALETVYNKIDVRKEKRYGKECIIFVRCHGIGDPTKDQGTLGTFREYLKKHLPAAKATISSNYYATSKPLSYVVSLATVSMVSKPSLCPDDAAVRSLIQYTDEDILSKVKAAHAEAHAAFEAEKEKERTISRAAQLLDWYRSDVEAKAKEITRFEQRLAALIAEFQCEVDMQARLMLEEAEADVAKQDTAGDYSPAARGLFHEHAQGYVRETKGRGIARGFIGAHGFNNEQAKEFLSKMGTTSATLTRLGKKEG